MYVVGLCEDSSQCNFHAKQATIMPKNMQLARYIRGSDLIPAAAPLHIEQWFETIHEGKGKSIKKSLKEK